MVSLEAQESIWQVLVGGVWTWERNLALDMVFVNSYHGGRKRNAVKQDSGRFQNMEMRIQYSQGKRHAGTLFLLI